MEMTSHNIALLLAV